MPPEFFKTHAATFGSLLKEVVSLVCLFGVTLSDGRQVPAIIEKSSAANDIAVLRIAASTPDYLSFTSTRSVQLGDQVFTVGFPTKSILGSEAKFTEGSISALSGIQDEAMNLMS